MSGSLFNAEPTLFARIATLPASRAEITRVDLRPADAGYLDRLIQYLHRLTDDPLVLEAIEVSSGSLSETLDKIHDGTQVNPSK